MNQTTFRGEVVLHVDGNDASGGKVQGDGLGLALMLMTRSSSGVDITGVAARKPRRERPGINCRNSDVLITFSHSSNQPIHELKPRPARTNQRRACVSPCQQANRNP